ncbi:MAG TPA: hypothetical protein DCS12_09055 [Clostridiales bacterium]|nr:hypothetical protein [Clostridiales bacterium]
MENQNVNVIIPLNEYNELKAIKKATEKDEIYIAMIKDYNFEMFAKIYGKKELQEFFKEQYEKLEKMDIHCIEKKIQLKKEQTKFENKLKKLSLFQLIKFYFTKKI